MLNIFRSSGRGKGTSLLVWSLLGLLIIGLTGLGLGGAVSSLYNQNVARVGDEPVETEDFVREVFSQIEGFTRQTGQSLTMSQARMFGVEDQALGALVREAAINVKTHEMGLSVGDAVIAGQLRAAPQFQGLSGGFDSQSYEFFLENRGLSAKEYEEDMRAQISRNILEVGVAAGMEMPPVMAETILAYRGESRGFSFLELRADQISEDIAPDGEATLRAFYDANPDNYTLPETRIVTYVALRPEDLSASMEVTDSQLQAAYDARAAQYNTPERRMIDLIAFGSESQAQEAKDRIDGGEITYGELVAERGLSDADISLGAVTAETLSADAREVVFGAQLPGVVGPVATDLGPGLYRINAILGARTQTLEDVAEDLRAELAAEAAASEVYEWIDPVQDLLASGATLEEIAGETPLVLGEIGITEFPGAGLAADSAFRAEAITAEPGEERDLIELENNGIAALRVERIDPPALQPFEDVKETVTSDWVAAEIANRLNARAQEYRGLLSEGRQMSAVASDAGLTVRTQSPVMRDTTLGPDLPASLIDTAFGLEVGGTDILSDLGRVYLVQLDEIVPVDTASENYASQLEELKAVLNGGLSNAIFQSYVQAVTSEAGVTVNRQLIDDTLAQYP